MSEFQLSFPIKKQEPKIIHGDTLLFLGSCFSDEIAAKASYCGFQVHSNPFGTIFHPLALGNLLQDILNSEPKVERIIQRSDLFFSLDASSSLYASSEVELKSKLNEIRSEWHKKLKAAKYLFVTFGTAYGYQLLNESKLVANCHKIPGSEFNKVLTNQNEIVSQWEMILKQLGNEFPDLKICFTVSPVRHLKDGIIENSRSKAILIDSVQKLMENPKSTYFPSYEIVLDELRDYRFFKLDRVHPNEEAINYVWNRFLNVYTSTETQNLCDEVQKIRLSEAHKSLFPESIEMKNHEMRINEKKAQFLKLHPEIDF